MKKSVLILTIACLLTRFTSVAAVYQVTNIGGSSNNVYAMGINDKNEIAGYVKPDGSWSSADAFYWNQTQGLHAIGGYLARDINNNGQIAGNSASIQAAVWDNGTWIPLEGRQDAYGINDRGQVTGLISAQPSIPGPYAPFRDDNIDSPGFTTLTRPYSRASHGFAINNKGQVVADCGSTVSGVLYVPVFYNADGVSTILDRDGNYDAHPRGINDAGQIVGNARRTNGDDFRAVFWDSYTEQLQYMGYLGDGDSIAYAINELGQAVGASAGKAFLWSQSEGIIDLNTLIDSSWGITLTQAMDINNQGSIIAWGIDSSGMDQSYLLVIPEPATLSLLAIGGLVLLRKRK